MYTKLSPRSTKEAPTQKGKQASPLKRLAALFYDSCILVALAFITTGIVLLCRDNQSIPSHTLWYQLLLLSIGLSYWLTAMRWGGQTIGMRAWQLKVIQSQGQPMNWASVFKRLCYLLISLLSFGIGYLWMFFDKQRHTWYERQSNTKMISTKP